MSKFRIEDRLGALPSPWDPRHYRVPRATFLQAAQLPDEMLGLLPYTQTIIDEFTYPNQGNVGSCVGWDGGIVMKITNLLEDKVPVDLSSGWCYWRSRIHANIPDYIEGSTNLGLIKALNKDGATTELCAKTDISKPFTISYCPTAFDIAEQYAIDEYWNINPNPSDIKSAIMGWSHEANYKMSNGEPGLIPLISAYPVYDSYYEANDNGGIVPLPKSGDRMLGGHSSALVGWKKIDGESHYINMNSWGDEVGDNGFYYLPEGYPFYENDFWLIHNGPPTDLPDPVPSPCNVGQGWALINNFLPQVLGRKGRFYYLNPR